jgi:hypothetical protein
MPVFHVEHKLADFDKWLAVFKVGNPRKEIEAKYGVKTLRVMQDADDRNHAIIVMEADSRSAIDEMINEPKVQERFADTSLFAEPPKVLAGYERFDVSSFTEGENPAVLVDHRVTDFDMWTKSRETNRDQRNEMYQKHGIKVIRELHDIEDRNHVVVVMLAPGRSAVENLFAEPPAQASFANKEVFQRAPRIIGQFNPIAV